MAQATHCTSSSAAAHRTGDESLALRFWKAPLFRWGSSCAVENSGRVRAPAPTANIEAVSSFVGAGPRPARDQEPAITCSAEPGAVLEPQQQQFLQTQGPVARIELRKATQILRAGNFLLSHRYVSPVMGSGESGPMDLGGAKRSRSPSAASPGAFCLLCRHGQSRSPPAGGETPASHNITRCSCQTP